MIRWLLFCLLSFSAFDAWADVTIEAPVDQEEVPLPFLIQGSAEPGQQLKLVADGNTVLVFRADDQGRFRVPVDLAGRHFSVESLDGASRDGVDVSIGQTRREQSLRVEQAQVDAQAVEAIDSPVQSASDEDATPEAVVERLVVPPAVDPNTIDYYSAPAPPVGPRWQPGAAAALQLTIGALAGLAGGTLGGATGYLVLEPALDFPAGAPIPSAATVVPLAVGFVAASTLSVWGIGQLMGGHSPWWGSVLGGVVGTLASFVFPPAAILLAPAGATAGYHLANRK